MCTVEINLKSGKVHKYNYAELKTECNNIIVTQYGYDTCCGMSVKNHNIVYNTNDVLSVTMTIENNHTKFEYHV